MRRLKGFLMTALLVSSIGVGSTMAYLTSQTPEIVNILKPGMVPPQVVEEFDGTVKRNVQVKNGGNVPAFIRALAVISWKDADGNIAPEIPEENQDYTIVWGVSEWKKIGDYYYCTIPVEPGGMSPVLMEAVQEIRKKTGYDLVVDIMVQTIQSQGTDGQGKTPAELAWKVIFENGDVRPASYGEGGSR